MTETSRVVIKRLSLCDFRNLAQITFEPAPRFNLIHGDNGHGKTSLIEALYVLSTTQSFRSKRLLETIREGTTRALIKGEVESLGLSRELLATIGPRGRSFLLDNQRPKKKLDYALKTPVIAFHPGDLLLAAGPATTRRTLLDRVMLYQDPVAADARLFYQKGLRHRQKLLSERGIRDAQLDPYEEVIARHGVRFSQGRARAAQCIVDALRPAFLDMAEPGLSCSVTYVPGGCQDHEHFVEQLSRRRLQDMSRGSASYGPQKDELDIQVGGRPARTHGSQGQQRIVTIAMKLAELSCVREVTNMEPILLLDDISSELDPARTNAVFSLLAEAKSQIFVTTTRPELFSSVRLNDGDRRDFRVLSGTLNYSKN